MVLLYNHLLATTIIHQTNFNAAYQNLTDTLLTNIRRLKEIERISKVRMQELQRAWNLPDPRASPPPPTEPCPSRTLFPEFYESPACGDADAGQTPATIIPLGSSDDIV